MKSKTIEYIKVVVEKIKVIYSRIVENIFTYFKGLILSKSGVLGNPFLVVLGTIKHGIYNQ